MRPWETSRLIASSGFSWWAASQVNELIMSKMMPPYVVNDHFCCNTWMSFCVHIILVITPKLLPWWTWLFGVPLCSCTACESRSSKQASISSWAYDSTCSAVCSLNPHEQWCEGHVNPRYVFIKWISVKLIFRGPATQCDQIKQRFGSVPTHFFGHMTRIRRKPRF